MPITNLNIDALNNAFLKTGMLEILGFLTDEDAHKLYSFLNNEMSNSNWLNSFYPINNKRQDVQNTFLKKRTIQKFRKKVLNELSNNKFAYQISRTIPHLQCACLICKTVQQLQSNEVIKYLENITGYQLTPGPMFASYYHQETFLSPHRDAYHEGIAFVLNLTKNWQPHFGGNLHFLSDDQQEIIKVITPKYNHFILFDLVNQQIPHFVSPVIPGIKEKRLAITGWYKRT